MSLLSSYNNSNKVTEQALQIRFTKDLDFETYQDEEGHSHTFIYSVLTRYATKRYKYVGMQYNTAINCQEAKVNKYTRVKYEPIAFSWDSHVQEYLSCYDCQADITVDKEDGKMWTCNITVNETDIIKSANNNITPQEAFDGKISCDYDQGGEQ